MDPWRGEGDRDRWRSTFALLRLLLLGGAAAGWLLVAAGPLARAAARAEPALAWAATLLVAGLLLELPFEARLLTWLRLLLALTLVWLLPLPETAAWPLAAALLHPRPGRSELPPDLLPDAGALAAGSLLLALRGVSPPLLFASVLLGLLALVTRLLHAALLREREEGRRQRGELEEAQVRLARYVAEVEEAAAARERAQVVGQIHDALGHSLTAAVLQVELARRLLASRPEEAAGRLEKLEGELRAALRQVRQALHGLGPVELGQRPLPEALVALADDFARSTGTEVELRFAPDRTAVAALPPTAAATLFATVREGLTNAVRHGKARRVQVRLSAEDGRLHLRMEDDGVGTESILPGIGLRTMTQRVQEAGGSLRFWSRPGQGFRIEVGLRARDPVK
ncbi:MAG: sensor histidine kinase [Clostridia bacterium]|nr:sensor histidine kinase [Clostridia bacterium]